MELSVPLLDYLPSLIETGGTIMTRPALILAFGIYYFIKAPDTNYRKVLLLPVGTLIQNSIMIYTIYIIALSLTCWSLGFELREISFFEITTDLPPSDRLLKEFISAISIFENLLYTGHR